MSDLKDYTVKRDGWVAGTYRKAGELVQMTTTAAKYEGNLTPGNPKDQAKGPRVETVGSLDDPLVKPKPKPRKRALAKSAPASDAGPRVETVGSLDDPLVKPDAAKPGRARK